MLASSRSFKRSIASWRNLLPLPAFPRPKDSNEGFGVLSVPGYKFEWDGLLGISQVNRAIVKELSLRPGTTRTEIHAVSSGTLASLFSRDAKGASPVTV